MYRVLILILIIFQTGGIRFFQGQGILLSIIIFLLIVITNLRTFIYINKKIIYLPIILIITLLIGLRTFDESLIKQFFVVSFYFINAYCFLLIYKNSTFNFLHDLKKALTFFLVQAFISILFIILPKQICHNGSMTYYSSLFFFFYSENQNTFFGGYSIPGLFWEPGVLQFFMNLLLFINIKNNTSLLKISLIIITIIFSFSTTGYILLIINSLYYVYNKKSKIQILYVIALIFLFSTVMLSNFNNKFRGDDKTSYIIRSMNIAVALKMIEQKPVFGHGIYESSFIFNNKLAASIMGDYIDESSIQTLGLENLGLTNGLLSTGVMFGLPFLLIMLYGLYKQRILLINKKGNIFLFLIFIISALSEPIFLTTFFIIFSISIIIFKKTEIQIRPKLVSS